jgi:DNA-binding SARP family transcriptional activator
VRCRILGQPQVEDGDRSVLLGGAKPRTLLAVLLVARGEVVPADRLVAAAWGDTPPAGGATALRAYFVVSRGLNWPSDVPGARRRRAALLPVWRVGRGSTPRQ